MSLSSPLADPEGRAPPNGTQFFRFHMCFCWKPPTTEVGAPPQQVGTTPNWNRKSWIGKCPLTSANNNRFSLARFVISFTCFRLSPRGFSHSTCLPAFNIWVHREWCAGWMAPMYTTSDVENKQAFCFSQFVLNTIHWMLWSKWL